MTRRNLFPLIAAPQLAQGENPKREKLKEEVKKDFYKNSYNKLRIKYETLLLKDFNTIKKLAQTNPDLCSVLLVKSENGYSYVIYTVAKLTDKALLNILDYCAEVSGTWDFWFEFNPWNIDYGTKTIRLTAEEANIKFAN